MANPKGRPQKYDAKVQDRSTSIRLTPRMADFVKRKAEEEGDSVTGFILKVLGAWERAEEEKHWNGLSHKLCAKCRPLVKDMLYLADPDTGQLLRKYDTPALSYVENE